MKLSSEPLRPADECYRCGYDIRGIANDRPCPECGLLTERSRRVTDELYDTRPRWLRAISLGVWLILLALLLTAGTPLVGIALESVFYRRDLWSWLDWLDALFLGGFLVAGALFVAGVVLLTMKEGYPPADLADRRRRRSLRILSALPLMFVLLAGLEELMYNLGYVNLVWDSPELFAAARLMAILVVLAAIPLPLLLFYQLRSLARRARSAHLIEHCAIVGIGASSALLYAVLLALVLPLVSGLHSDPNWLARSDLALVLLLLISVAACLFLLWATYLLVRFAIAFHRAARQLRAKWQRDDLATAAV